MPDRTEREALAAELDRHVEEEDEILREYHGLSDRLPDGPLSVLVNHIMTEEEMHHFLLRTLSDWLRSPRAPQPNAADAGPDRDAILRATRALQRHEKKTIDASRALRPRLSAEGGEIFAVLLDAITLDSQKHHRLLEIVEKTIRG